MNKEHVMYFGPAVPGLIKENAVFRDGLPGKVAERAKKDKDFARLLVPADKIFEARQELGVEGSVLDVAYTCVEKSLL